MFGGVNINKSHLKEPTKPVDLEQAKLAYEAKLKEKLDALEKREAQMKARAAANQRDKYFKHASAASSAPAKKAAIVKPVMSISDLEKKIAELKAKMTPSTANSAKRAASRPAGAPPRPKRREEPEDDLGDLYVAATQFQPSLQSLTLYAASWMTATMTWLSVTMMTGVQCCAQ